MSFPLPFCSHSDQQQTVEAHQQPCGIEIECYVPERRDSCKQELDWRYGSICETCEQLRFFVVEFVHILHVTSLLSMHSMFPIHTIAIGLPITGNLYEQHEIEPIYSTLWTSMQMLGQSMEVYICRCHPNLDRAINSKSSYNRLWLHGLYRALHRIPKIGQVLLMWALLGSSPGICPKGVMTKILYQSAVVVL